MSWLPTAPVAERVERAAPRRPPGGAGRGGSSSFHLKFGNCVCFCELEIGEGVVLPKTWDRSATTLARRSRLQPAPAAAVSGCLQGGIFGFLEKGQDQRSPSLPARLGASPLQSCFCAAQEAAPAVAVVSSCTAAAVSSVPGGLQDCRLRRRVALLAAVEETLAAPRDAGGGRRFRRRRCAVLA